MQKNSAMTQVILCLFVLVHGVVGARFKARSRDKFASMINTSNPGDNFANYFDELAINLANDFDEGTSTLVKDLVTHVVQQGKQWITQFKQEEKNELVKTCNKDAGMCGPLGCSKSLYLFKDVNRGECVNDRCICPDTMCGITKLQDCFPMEQVEKLLKDKEISAADLAPSINGIGDAFQAAGEFVAELPENLGAGLAEHAFAYAAALAEHPLLMSEVLRFARTAKEEICMATKLARHQARDAISESVTALSTSMKAGLEKGLASAATMIVDALKFIFSPAEAVPHIGITLKSMLHSLAEWAGQFIHKRLTYLFAVIVDELLLQLFDMNSGEALPTIMSKISTIFKCPSFESISGWVKQLVASAQ